MKKIFKHGNKRIIDTKLVKDAIAADAPIEDFEELIDVDSEGRLKAWTKGFLSGGATAILGITIGVTIGIAINQAKED